MNASRELMHFLALTDDERSAAILELAALGWSDYAIAGATRLSVEAIQAIRRSAVRTSVRHDGTVAPCSAFSSDTRS
jgi:DNA-binding NarL/FixJ family response regulator